MPGDFEEVLSKFRWASHHLALLEVAVADYLALKPYVTVVEDQPDAQAKKVIARLRYPPPASIAHLVGDVLNNLHGTLDYLAWQLVLREGRTPDRRSYFPIVSDAPDEGTAHSRVNVFRAKSPGRGLEPLIEDTTVLQLLARVQPYNLPDAERQFSPLRVLADLNGKSKHRRPAVLATGVFEALYPFAPRALFGIPLPDGGQVAVIDGRMSPAKDGDEVAWVPYSDLPEDGLPEHDDFPVFVVLEEAPVLPRTGEPFPVTELLRDAVMFIDSQILVPFADLF